MEAFGTSSAIRCERAFAATPEDWPWSSHAATAGIAPRPNFLTVGTVHGWFGATASEATTNYRAFVDAGLDAPVERPTLEKLIDRGTLDEVATANETYGYSLREIAHSSAFPRRHSAGGYERRR